MLNDSPLTAHDSCPAGLVAPCADRLNADLDVSTDVTEEAWNAFVESRQDASGYHQWGWRRVFARAFGHECVYLAAKVEGRMAGILPLVLFDSWLFGRFIVSLPFVNYGGVIAETGVAARALVTSAESVCAERRAAHLELRHLRAWFPELPAKRHKVAMVLPLPADPGTLWSSIDRKVRNQIRKAEKSSLSVESGGADLVPVFYTVFARNMRDLGTPVYSRRFFEAIFAEFPQAARVFLVRKGMEPIAASITLRWRETLEAPWASSLREYRALCPNMLLYWTMLEHAIERGCSRFDFGRSTPNEGTFHFKRQWGAESTPCIWEYALVGGGRMPDQSPANPKFRFAVGAWRHLPVRVATWLGPSIVRSIP